MNDLYKGEHLSPAQAKRRRSCAYRILSQLRKVGDTSWPEAGYVIDSTETDWRAGRVSSCLVRYRLDDVGHESGRAS